MTSNSHLTTSLIGGFSASILTFLALPFVTSKSTLGQLLAGNQADNQDLPTTLNMIHSAQDGTNLMVSNLLSMSWWMVVMIGGIIASLVLFKWMRRYV